MEKIFSQKRKEIHQLTTRLTNDVVDHLVKNNVGILSLVVADTDGVYSVCEGSDEMFRVGAIVIPEDSHGERWIGIIDWEDIFQKDCLSFLKDEKSKPVSYVDEALEDRSKSPRWFDYVQCIDDSCMFPLDTYYQISEAVEQALPVEAK